MDRLTAKSGRLDTGEVATSYWSYLSQYDQFKEQETLVSVRQVPPNRRSVTGLLPSRKNARMVPFESALERDLATLLEFDDSVATFEAQPVEIRYQHAGRLRRGVPDFLVTYHEGVGRRPMLCDVKYREELFKRWPELKPRLRAAKRHASEHGWDYRILTEAEIRTPFLRNARFLLPYQRCAPDPRHERLLVDTMSRMEMATPQVLLEACCADLWNRAQLIPTLWCLVGRGRISIDLDEPLGMGSVIWLST